MIAVVDYEMGNLRSVQKGFEAVGREAVVTRDARVIARADGVVLPGVGSFGACMRNLGKFGLVEPVRAAIASGKPFLGICLGLQLLFTESEEFGRCPGLDVIRGKVVRFPENVKIPHMGWNSLAFRKRAPIFGELADGAYVYFVHSYYVVPEDLDVVATVTPYAAEFVSAVWRDNVYGVQFHPEKSQSVGLEILKRFGSLC